MSVQFHAQLLAESLDEAADLFVRRCQYLNPPQSGLTQVLEVDTRMDAHLDLLFYGAATAIEVCATNNALSAGAIYAGARTLVRLGQWEAWRNLADQVAGIEDDPERLLAGEPKALQALASAAAHEPWPEDLANIEATLAAGGDSAFAHCLAYAAGYHKWDVVAALAAGIEAGVASPVAWLWALGQIDEGRARPTLLPLLESPDPTVARAAAMGLCRTEDDQMAYWLASQARNQLWAPVVLAFLGGPSAATSMSQHIETGDAYAVLAAGLLGDGALVPVLLETLNNPEHAASAAQSLHLITGRAPMEQVLEPINDDWQLAQSRETWEQAIARAGIHFNASVRYRMGEPATPLQSIWSLQSAHLRQDLRALVIDELFVRFGLGVHLRADQHAGRQLRVLSKLQQFLPQMATKTPPGSFAFQGRHGVG